MQTLLDVEATKVRFMPSWNSSSGESSGDKHITLEENTQNIWRLNRRQQFLGFAQLTSSYGLKGTSEETLKFFMCQEFEWTNPQIIFYIEGPRHYELRTWIWNHSGGNKLNFQLSKAMHERKSHSITWNSRIQFDINILLWFFLETW